MEYSTTPSQDDPQRIMTDPEDDTDDAREKWAVEKILSMKLRGCRVELKVQWKGYQASQGQWKQLKELQECRPLVRKFVQAKKPGRDEKERRCITYISKWLKNPTPARRVESWRYGWVADMERLYRIKKARDIKDDEQLERVVQRRMEEVKQSLKKRRSLRDNHRG